MEERHPLVGGKAMGPADEVHGDVLMTAHEADGVGTAPRPFGGLGVDPGGVVGDPPACFVPP